MKIRAYGKKWQADAGFINGRRLRKIFDSQKDAKLWIAKMDDRKDAEKLHISDINHRDAADATRAISILGGKTSLAEAARFWSTHHNDRAASKFSGIQTEFLRYLKERNSRPRYIEGMEDTLNAFVVCDPELLIGDCTTERLLSWLRNPDWSKATFANRRRELSVFFNWCVKQGIIALNPVARIPSPKLEQREIEVLTPEQAERLLRGIPRGDVAYFALAMFAGIRPGELDRLTWEDVGTSVEIGAHAAKARSRRLVRIEPNLADWLAVCDKGGPICRRDKFEMCRMAASAAGLPCWSPNICRHSFASYHLQHFGDINGTALQLGHTTTAMLFKHYREVVTAEAAAKFWNIRPTKGLWVYDASAGQSRYLLQKLL